MEVPEETAVTCLGTQPGKRNIIEDRVPMPSPLDRFPKERHCCNLSVEGHRNEQRKWDTHTMLYDSAIKSNETMGSSGTGKKVGMIIAA